MTEMSDDSLLIHKQMNPSFVSPRLDLDALKTFQVQANLARKVMATQIAPNKFVVEVTFVQMNSTRQRESTKNH